MLTSTCIEGLVALRTRYDIWVVVRKEKLMYRFHTEEFYGLRLLPRMLTDYEFSTFQKVI